MPVLNSITADPTTVTPGQTSLVTVDASPDPVEPDRSYRVEAVVVGSDPPQTASITITLDNPPEEPVVFTLDPATAVDGDVLVTAPDGGTLSVTGSPHQFTFTP